MSHPANAREEILARIRNALEGADRSPVEVPRGYRTPPAVDQATLVDRFVARVEDYRAVVTRCSPAGTTDAVAAALAGSARVVVPDGLAVDLPSEVEVVSDTGLTAADLDAVDAVVTEAALGIAETGTIVLDHGPGQGRRALSLVPDLHVCVVRADQVVPDVPQAVAALDPRHPQTWVSGPSATSDIELSRVEGVHGPRTLHVVLVGRD
ncbi:MAG: LutC/YkgG family protein [Nocardioidaceae bacterium]